MIKGQGWEGMYFLDKKLQFLCKYRSLPIYKSRKIGENLPKGMFWFGKMEMFLFTRPALERIAGNAN